MQPEARISVGEKVGYGLGDLANNAYLGVLSLFILYYYTDVFGIDPGAAGLLLLLSRALDAVTDPVMGILADRTHSRWGRYRPYLLWIALPLSLSSTLVFLGPDLSDTGKLVFAYLSFGLFMLLFTAITVPYSALTAVMSSSSEERVKITQVRFVFGHSGTLLVGATVMPLVNTLGQENEALGFLLAITVFAALGMLCYLVSFASTKERLPPGNSRSPRGDIYALFSNRNWQILFAVSCLTLVGLVCRLSSIIFFFKYYVLQVSPASTERLDLTAVFTAIGFLGPILGALVSPMLAKRIEKHQLILAMNVLHALLLVLGLFVPPHLFTLNVTLHFIGLTTFGVTLTMIFSMYTDCAAYERWKSGANIAGLTLASSLFAMKFGSAFGAAIPGFVMAYVGFVPNEVQTERAVLGIRLMFTLVPSLLFLASAVLAGSYKLDRATLRLIESGAEKPD